MSMNDLYSCEHLQSKKEQQDCQAFCRTNVNDNLPIRSNLVQVPTAQQKNLSARKVAAGPRHVKLAKV